MTVKQGKRLEAAVSELLYTQLQVVRKLNGIASDADLVRTALQFYVDQHAESITSARYFSSTFRGAVRRLEEQQRFYMALNLVVALAPQRAGEFLGDATMQQLLFTAPDVCVKSMQLALAGLEKRGVDAFTVPSGREVVTAG